MRLYTTNGGPSKYSIDTVSVSNCSGTLSEAAFLIGVTNGSSPNSVASLTISDCSLVAPTVLGIAENFGTIALKNVTFIPSRVKRCLGRAPIQPRLRLFATVPTLWRCNLRGIESLFRELSNLPEFGISVAAVDPRKQLDDRKSGVQRVWVAGCRVKLPDAKAA